MTRFFSETLGKHDRGQFSSGNEAIDAYFRTRISQDVRRNYAKAFVLIEKETEKVAGFYTLSATNIPLGEVRDEVARKLPRYPVIPAALIGWLGRDVQFKGQDVGGILIRDAIVRAARSDLGAHAICADAIDESARQFYLRFQFEPFESRPNSLFLPMAAAIQALGKSAT